jgi:dihydrodipicolinate reductase
MKIGISGFFGRMGQEIANIVINDPTLKLVAEIDKNHSVIKETPDIWIDFSAEVALLTLLENIDAKTKIVSGTT